MLTNMGFIVSVLLTLQMEPHNADIAEQREKILDQIQITPPKCNNSSLGNAQRNYQVS